MDNTMYRIEGSFVKGFLVGFRLDNSFVGKYIELNLGFLSIGYRFFSELDKKNYPIKTFKWY